MTVKAFYVYIVASRSRVLYTGMTNDLDRRLAEHKSGTFPGFAAKYRCNRLVWFEEFSTPAQAIESEKRIKGWTRAKKIAMIDEQNPAWLDLAINESSTRKESADSSLRSE